MSGPTDPVEQYFDKGLWGWDLTQWRKLPMIWGYSDRWAEQVSDLTADAGTNVLSFTAVPDGYVYVLQALGGVDVTSGASIELTVVGGGVTVHIVPAVAKGAGVWEWKFPIDVCLKKDDYASITFYGCTAGDDLYGRAWGYKMAVAE